MTHPLALLLHLANAAPPMTARGEFYALKDRLLARYATPDGAEWQILRDACWGDTSKGCIGAKCWRCDGTGIYRSRQILLSRWTWGPYRFHGIAGTSLYNRGPWPVGVYGYVRHQTRGRLNAEAGLWLFLLCGEWRTLGRVLRESSSRGWYAWPLLNLQRVVMQVAMWLAREDCHECGRRFFCNRGGCWWNVCSRCRGNVAIDGTEVPF